MIDRGDTAWILTATALVLFMTLPGLALFYAGLVRAKNILSVLMHCVAIACLVSVLWIAVALQPGFVGSAIRLIGDLCQGVPHRRGARRGASGTTIPDTVFIMFQMTFAIITPGADHRRLCRAHQVLGRAAVLRPVADRRLRAGRALGVGRRLARGNGRDGLCRRHRRAHDGRRVGAGRSRWPLGKRDGFPRPRSPPHAPWLVMVGAAHAVGRLVRLQRRQRAHRRRRRRHGDAGDASRPPRSPR